MSLGHFLWPVGPVFYRTNFTVTVHLYHYDIVDNNNTYYILYVYLYILVGEEYEGLSEELYLQSKCLLDLRKDMSPSQFSVIQTEHNVMCIVLLLFIIH